MASPRPAIISPDILRGNGDRAARTPPGQTLTRKWPVLHYGDVPRIDPRTWKLRIWGLCENPYELDWEQFNALPKVDLKCDIHCVTHWSRLDNAFIGVSAKLIVEMAKPLPTAKYVLQYGQSEPGDRWSTNLPLAEFIDEDCILATHHDGLPISAEHGGPVRRGSARLYFWKGKWISGIELRATDAPGFWEVNGYHMHGDPWTQERFRE